MLSKKCLTKCKKEHTNCTNSKDINNEKCNWMSIYFSTEVFDPMHCLSLKLNSIPMSNILLSFLIFLEVIISSYLFSFAVLYL